jgi:dihydrofolate reductase
MVSVYDEISLLFASIAQAAELSAHDEEEEGGGEIIASFLDHGEIDEFRIHVIPIPVAQPSGCAPLTLFFLYVCQHRRPQQTRSNRRQARIGELRSGAG